MQRLIESFVVLIHEPRFTASNPSKRIKNSEQTHSLLSLQLKASETMEQQLGQQHLSNVQHQYSCSCGEPRRVTLVNNGSHVDCKNKLNLIENLRTHGWSPITVEAPTAAPSQKEILAMFRRCHQRRKFNTECTGDVTFIAAESGSSEGTVEPKESLEISLSKCSTNNEEDKKEDNVFDNRREDNMDETTIKTWCLTLSWIAHKICRSVLDIPKNLFLPDDPDESLDLMRIFHYYAVSTKEERAGLSPTLGSSEHTDWGSITVVWQDSVGGLQTFCRSCQKWINVSPTKTKEQSHRWECIVHVGDMASLLLNKIDSIDILSNNTKPNNLDEYVAHPWPSPKHRVTSHPHKERVSLVYFGYPPRLQSLQRIQNRLNEGWQHSRTTGQRLPLGDYYLLRNQSAENTGSTDKNHEASRLCQTFWDIPVQDIVRLKWEQVNRDG